MIIRKISVGSDYKTAMNYIVGQDVLNKSHVIHHIARNDDGSFVVYIERNKEVLMWKKFSNTMPISIEFDIEFI
jgi:type IV secretory pathway VirD2 relaxase